MTATPEIVQQLRAHMENGNIFPVTHGGRPAPHVIVTPEAVPLLDQAGIPHFTARQYGHGGKRMATLHSVADVLAVPSEQLREELAAYAAAIPAQQTGRA